MAYTFGGLNYLMQSKALVAAPPMTFVCFLKLGTLTADAVIMGISSIGAGHNSFFEMLFHTATAKLCAGIGNDASTVTDFTCETSATLTTGIWYHCAVVYTSATSRTAYLNGANSGSSSVPVTPGTLDTSFIGAIIHGGSIHNGPAGGSIAFPGFFNVALLPGDLASLALGEGPLHEHPTSLSGYSRMVGLSPEPDLISGSWTIVSG